VAAVRAARRAFDETEWSTNVERRVGCLRQLHDALQRHRQEFADLTMAECGHTSSLIAGPALDDPVALLSYYADLAPRFPIRGLQAVGDRPGDGCRGAHRVSRDQDRRYSGMTQCRLRSRDR
jgi:aldehyde dehydrogenase (NAD+)